MFSTRSKHPDTPIDQADDEHWIQECPNKPAQDAPEARDPDKPPPGYVCKICQSASFLLLGIVKS